MRYAVKIGRSTVLPTVCGFAFGLTGVAFAGVARHATAAKVTVTFTDTTFGVSRGGLQAGKATFVVVNRGRKPHLLTISGPGLKNIRTSKLATGGSATLTVTLRTGAYMLTDPLGKSSTHWIVVSPATVVHASGTTNAGTTPVFNDPGMNCD
jgi:hypothetical protein